MSRRGRKAANKPKVDFSDSSDDEIKEGINDLMNLPIELLRKELIARNFQPTVVEHLPKWQLSSMLRESTASTNSSFFCKVLGYSTYWTKQARPIFTKEAEKILKEKEKEIEEESQNLESQNDIDVDEWSSFSNRNITKNSNNNNNNNNNNIFNNNNFLFWNQNNNPNWKWDSLLGKYIPKTIVTQTMPKLTPPPSYVPPVFVPVETSASAENCVSAQKAEENLDVLPIDIIVQLLNNNVKQSSIDSLSVDQIHQIRDDFKGEVDISAIIQKYELELERRKIVQDSQYEETQKDESESAKSDSSNSESESGSGSSSGSESEKEDEDDEDDHRFDRY